MPEQSYQLVRSRGVGHAVASFSRACLIRLIDFPEMPLRVNTHETVKAGRTALVVRTAFPVENRRVAAAYKRVRRQNWWKSLADMFATHRLLRTWRLGRELRRRLARHGGCAKAEEGQEVHGRPPYGCQRKREPV